MSPSPSLSALLDTPGKGILASADVPVHLLELHAMDLVRQERIRGIIDENVEDEATAESLKSLYPSWCKRPTFHDEYLPTFNQKNGGLVDTDGKGVDCRTENAIVVNGEKNDVDCLVFSTGFRSPYSSSPARVTASVLARNLAKFSPSCVQSGTFLPVQDLDALAENGPDLTADQAVKTYDMPPKNLTQVYLEQGDITVISLITHLPTYSVLLYIT
ncbi:hypothetical protein LTR66_005559 [Elasticomyces elasticus]|nr:hypothetical protein LTR66_005559 [Elasticomyces elasticus]